MNVASIFTVLVVAAGAFAAATVLTGRFRRYALSRGLMDIPNARSSHVVPTPRGGGVAIVVATLLSIVALTLLGVVTPKLAVGLCGGGAVAATIGYLDDKRGVGVIARLAAHFVAAAFVVWAADLPAVFQSLRLSQALLSDAHIVLIPFALVYVVWMLNLTNFMDGVDGIASTEVICVCLGLASCIAASSLSSISGAALEFLGILLAITGATAGFLRWNWPPAKIFMGDAGSGFLGVLLGALTLVAAAVSPSLLWSSVILGGVFVVDATVTLVRRIARREKFYQAHRSHAYQHAARRTSHKHVTVAVALINMLWLLPWGVLTARGMVYGPVAMAIAYIPLVATAVRLNAGKGELQ